jgi:hypothetical protein
VNYANLIGIRNADWKPWTTPDGIPVLVPGDFNTEYDAKGDLYQYPKGDRSVPPSAVMPKGGYYFDAIIRQEPFDEDNPSVDDNMEEFQPLSADDTAYYDRALHSAAATGRAVVCTIGGTGIGDIALVPAMQLKHPKGVREISDWYMSTVTRQDYLLELFDRQSDIAVQNLETIYRVAGDCVDVIYLCGTDFGTQTGQFCSPEALSDLYGPAYRKMNDWVHRHTHWKTFKHCCGAIVPLMETFIDMGFDIINPVQINATGMNPQYLKDTFGDRITFWGGGIDTQKVLPLGTPQEVRDQVRRQCDVLGKDGGFVFNGIHNIQANVPVANAIALMDAISEIRKIAI